MESRMAPFFMVSTQPQEPTPFVYEQIVEPRYPELTVARGDSAADSKSAEDVAYAHQLKLLKKWRDSLDGPWSSPQTSSMPGGGSRPESPKPSVGLARTLWQDRDPLSTDCSALRVRSGDEAPRKRQSDGAKAAIESATLAWVERIPTDRVLEYRQFLTPYRPISKCRETRAIEKDERRQLADHDELRRRKQLSFCRSLVARRDDLFKANKSKRNDAARCARACKAHFEAIFHRAEVEESKAGRKRLQALRANDMEAYSKLLEETKNQRLKFLLEQTDNYIVSITKKVKAQRQHEEHDEAREAERAGLGETVAMRNRKAKKRMRLMNSSNGAEEESGSPTNMTTEDDRRRATTEYYEMTHQTTENVTQPKMMVGGQLKEYQMAGLSWLVSLYNNRLNGILADEMGLGKTIQSIALIAHLAEKKRNFGPFMVVAPLSTLSNWANEFAKWTPGLVALSYKGPPAARKEVQKEIQRYLKMRKRTGRVLSRAEIAAGKKRMMDDDDDENDRDYDDDNEFLPDGDDDEYGAAVGASHEKPNFSVLLTTYEYVMRDRAVLRKVDWQYIIVDEGHRMKNANSKFAQTLGNLYTAKRRLLLTGTPLQNSLPELWALLNFLLPSIFSSVDTFEGWFNKPFAQFGSNAAQPQDDALGHEERMLVINRLHEVLRPFVLRRVKAAVLGQLPEKVEKVIRCDLSAWQKILYEQIRSRRSASSSSNAVGVDEEEQGASGDASVANGNASNTPRVNRGGLNNVLMQLRKCCNHPYLFRTDSYRIDETMIRASGKFLVLDSMLPKFKAAGHRVLLFSQMTAAMDLLEEFFTFRGFKYLRLDGSTSAEERERRVATFNDPCSPAFIFLLSTRAGGLGLNLASADTVIIFDSDWNPMMDAQAQDRAHRIGQRNDVRVFRLVAAAPVEERILARATDKLNMNSLVVEAGKFNKDSRAHERKQMLEELLKEYACTDESNDQPEGSTCSGGANDDASSSNGGGPANGGSEQLAEIIATSNDELASYNRFDAERESKGLVLRPMTVGEVPEWVKAGADSSTANLDAATQQREDPDMFLDARQRAGRKKKDTPYYDSLSERSFLKLVESGSLDQPTTPYKAVGRPGSLTVKLIKQPATPARKKSSGRR